MPGTIVAIIVLPYIHRQVDVEIRNKIRDMFAACYSNFDVEVRSATLVEGCGIVVRDFTIRDPHQAGPQAVLVDLEQVTFRCTTNLADLIGDRLVVDRVTIQRPTFRITRAVDGSWSFGDLWPMPKFGDSSPDIYIENGTVELVDESKPTPSRWTLRDVNLSVVMRRDEITGELVRKLEGHLLGDYLDLVQFKGSQSMDSKDWSITGSVAKVDISPEFHQALPIFYPKEADLFADFRGKASLAFGIHSDPTQPHGVRFEAAGEMNQGRLDDARLLYPITEIQARFRATPKDFSITGLQGKFGQAVISLNCCRAGYDAHSLWDVNGTIKNLQLEPRLVAGLPERCKDDWRKFSPSGRVDAQVKLLTDGRTLNPEHCEVTVDCHDVTTVFHKFPYQVDHGFGRLVLKNDVLTIQNMQFKGANDQPIFVAGEWKKPFKPNPVGWVQMKGYNLPIDKRLYDAVNEVGRKTMQRLELGGVGDFWARIERKTPTSKATQHFVLDLKDASICLKTFPYPMKHIRGRVERLPNKSWKFSDLTAVNGSSAISASGYMVKHGADDHRLHFNLHGRNVILGDELCSAFSQKPSIGQAWKNLRPSGAVDVQVEFDLFAKANKLNMTVEATPRGDTVSIEPVSFPYRLEKLRGSMIYKDGHVEFSRFSGQHGSMTVSGKGSCVFMPHGMWQLHLKDMEVVNLDMNRELIQACPPQLRKGLTNLQPKGSMYISRGVFVLNRSLDPTVPAKAAWDFMLGFHQSSLDCGVRLENLNGTMHLRGDFDGEHHRSKGELGIDSLMYKGFQFTEIRGPIWINDDVVWFGSPDYGKGQSRPNPKRPSTENPQKDTRALTYKFYGGNGTSIGKVQTGNRLPQYRFESHLVHGNLARFAQETSPGIQDVKGEFSSHVLIEGKGRTLNGLYGKGTFQLRNADIYKLPVMVRLLKILTNGKPNDATAFSKADVQFKIENGQLFLSPIKFNGDAISLVGQGTMDFNSKVDLAFHAVVGRNDIWLPGISPLVGEVSRQTMMIHVKGPLSNPNVSRDVLPGVKEALLRLEGKR